MVPKTEKQNLDVVAIAEQYYKVDKKVPYLLNNITRWTGKIEIPIIATNVFQICEAKQNSGKTIWIGINSEVNQNEWKISGLRTKEDKSGHFNHATLFFYSDWLGGNETGKRVGYTNWKDANPNGNCAYLFTKVTTFNNHDFDAIQIVSVSDRSWEQGEMGRRDLLDQLGAQLVHNLPVRRGCC